MGHEDIRYAPAYDVTTAARYLLMPRTTLHHWAKGTANFKAVLDVPNDASTYLSFINLIESHVLFAMRRHHRLSLQQIREAIDYVSNEMCVEHPLAKQRFETDGVDLFVREIGKVINVSKRGQIAMKELIGVHLNRVVWGEDEMPSALYPFTTPDPKASPRIVVINPKFSFGQPVIGGTGIPTLAIAQRYKAGETIEELSEDYDLSGLKIQEAIRCELQLEAA